MNDIHEGKLAPSPAHIVYVELDQVDLETEPVSFAWVLFLLLLVTALLGDMLGAFDPEITYIASII